MKRDKLLIAIVDDDTSICRALSRLIRAESMDAETFSSAVDFLEIGEKHEPDCLILDVQMPGMTGLELQKQLTTRNSRIPIIFITAHDEALASCTHLTSGVIACLKKPFNDKLLLDAIAMHHLNKHGMAFIQPDTAEQPVNTNAL